MLCHVPSNVFTDTAYPHDGTQDSFAGIIGRDGKDTPVVAQAFVLLHDLKGNVEQADIRFHTCFLPMGVYPYTAVERVGHDVFLPKVLQVNISQPRKGTEEEQIADKRPFEVHLRSIDKQSEFLLGEKAFFNFLLVYLITRKRITRQPAVLHSFMQQHADRKGIESYGIGAQTAVCTQVSLEIRNEGRQDFFQSDIANMIMRLQKIFQVVVYGIVFI